MEFFHTYKSWTLSWLKVVVFLWVVDQVSPFAPENKKLKPGLNAIHRLSPNNRSGWRNRGGERRRRACTQETSSGGLVKDKSWVGGWVESSESLRCCEGALPPPPALKQCWVNTKHQADLTYPDNWRGVTQSQLIIWANCCLCSVRKGQLVKLPFLDKKKKSITWNKIISSVVMLRQCSVML